MTSLVDERGFNQGYALTKAQTQRLTRRTEAMLEEMGRPFCQPTKILELGCGTGEVARLLAQTAHAEVLGLDLSPTFVQQAQARYGAPNLSFLTADITRDMAGFPEESYDFVTGNGVLHHVHAELDRVLSGLKRILRPGGKLIFWEPNYLNPYIYAIFTVPALRSRAHLEPAEMAFTPGFIGQKLQAIGMAETRVQTRDFLLPNTPESLINPVIALGGVLEVIPGVRAWAQSLFIVSRK